MTKRWVTVQTAGNLAEILALSLLKSQNFRQIPHWMDIQCFLSGADGQEDAPSELLQRWRFARKGRNLDLGWDGLEGEP